MTADAEEGGGAQRAAASLFGRGLAGLFGVAGRLRPTEKPLHPRGSVSSGTVRRFGLRDAIGVPWVDEPGEDEVTVRTSRAVGLPGGLPDVLGLAIRVPVDGDRHGDLLLASTGLGRISRFVLVPARDVQAATFSTLLPYRAPTGAVLIAATPVASGSGADFELQVARPGGPWRRFGAVDVAAAGANGGDGAAPDAEIAFDPMTNTIPGLQPYEWVRQLRQRSYGAARRSRADARVHP